MKKESGLSMVGAVIAVLVIIAIVATGIIIANTRNDENKDIDIKSDMVLIQGKVKLLKKESVAKNDESCIIGANLNQTGSDFIVNYFKTLGIIEEADYEKYYRIDDEALEVMKLDVRNQPESLYLANYETGEVIITKGFNGMYKLSDILKADEAKKKDTENKTE